VGVEICRVMVPLEEEVFMDARRMGFRDATFDVVLLVAVLHHFVDAVQRRRCL